MLQKYHTSDGYINNSRARAGIFERGIFSPESSSCEGPETNIAKGKGEK